MAFQTPTFSLTHINYHAFFALLTVVSRYSWKNPWALLNGELGDIWRQLYG